MKNKVCYQVIYGSSELNIIVCWEANDELEKRLGYVGRPGPGCQLKIIGGFFIFYMSRFVLVMMDIQSDYPSKLELDVRLGYVSSKVIGSF